MRLIIDTMFPLLDYYTIYEHESSEFGYNQFNAEVDIRFYIDLNIYNPTTLLGVEYTKKRLLYYY